MLRISPPLGFAACLWIFLCFAALAQTAPDGANPTVEGDSSGWTVYCDKAAQGLSCKAMEEIRLKKTHQLLVSTTVNMASDGKGPVMLVRLPHGVYLPAGANLQVGKRPPHKLNIQTCDAAGCYAALPLSKDVLATLQSEAEMSVIFQDLQRHRVTVRMSLRGFDAAYKKIR